jgi:hypothetical protein
MTRIAPAFTAATKRGAGPYSPMVDGRAFDGRHAAGPDQHVGLEAQSRYPDQMQVARAPRDHPPHRRHGAAAVVVRGQRQPGAVGDAHDQRLEIGVDHELSAMSSEQ